MSEQRDDETTTDAAEADAVAEGPVTEEPETVPGDEDRNP